LVLEQGEMYSGLIVDHVLGMQHFAAEGFRQQVSSSKMNAVAPFVEGCYKLAGEHRMVLRPTRLIADERFMKLAG
ncbi:MAG: chemotaxis protein CheW, partial [Gammaproteobacteria bacterium]